MKVIEVNRSVTEDNDRDAERMREEMKEEGVFLVNLMSSPGSGKTTLLSRVIKDLKRQVSISVLEADIASEVDAVRIASLGASSIQVHTSGMCHMDAGMTETALKELSPKEGDLVFLENVGNLICPAEFDTGASLNAMILSLPEGDDKPLKYPLMFATSDCLVVTKTDTAPYFPFDMEALKKRVLALNPDIRIFPLSARTGEGMEAFEAYLLKEREKWMKGKRA